MTLVAASVLAGRLRLSAIPIFIVAGILLGPSPGFPTIIEPSEGTDLLARLGIVLLLFFLGLEFSLDRLTAARRMVVVGGLIELVVNGGLGLLVGIALLGPSPEAVLLAGLIYISSSGIVTRALFDLRRLGDDETDLVLGVLVGRWAHHAIDRIGPRLDREQLLLGSLAIALGGAALGEAAGLSEAVGALLAGILLSGSEVRNQIEQQLLGLRDFAAAIFFFAFGLEVDLGETSKVVDWLLLAVPVAVAGTLVGGYLAGRFTGFTSRESVNVGTALVARGQFTIILAELAAGGVALDVAFRDLVSPFAGLFVLATAVAGVVLMRESRRIGRLAFPSRTPSRQMRR